MPSKVRPRNPDRAPNLLHGGKKSDTCPRCHFPRNKKDKNKGKLLHGIPEVTDSEQLRSVLVTIDRNLRQDQDLMKDPDAVFMMGVLEAKISGREHFLIASSGRTAEPWIREKHLNGISYHQGAWETVNPAPPAGHRGWLTVRGETVDLAPNVAGVTRPCSAVKLLLGLGGKRLEWKSVEYLRMSEMVYVGPEADDAGMRNWHGKGATNSWTAHSCDACQARIPYLICDVPTNQIVD
ncbi:hypothetical protein RM550_01545 [Streptomyces sp. DSM 41527]|uniref:Uncharacterized protein n=1 Tax=Streptomyces mooreae TaxID=3075523 RepID=A0ABU2SZJ8_9ACTN|nr:hypothetical protein [Streptomyces sp. DSM 41527]MDT0454423.1 hypothetical protein [Streptomyces sp. DSM 41527]